MSAVASSASTGALFVIGGTIVWPAVRDYVAMILLLRIADSRYAVPPGGEDNG